MIANPLKASGSMAGYSFWTWLAKNKQTLKDGLAILFGIATAYAGMISSPVWNTAAAGLVGVLSKLAFDAIDYFLTEQPQPQ